MIKKRAVVYLLVFVICFGLLVGIGSFLDVNALNFLNPFYEGLVDLGIFSNAQIYIDSPLNRTYNFSKGDNYTLNLSVSSNFNLSSWRYNLISLPSEEIIYDNVPFTPNTTFNAVRRINELIVFANDTGGNVFNKSVIFFISIPNSNPIMGEIDDEILVCEAYPSGLNYFFEITDVDGDSLDISIDPMDTFFASSYPPPVTQYRIYSGKLSKANAGGVDAGSKLYQEIVSVSDGQGGDDSAQTNITVIEINNAPIINNIGVQTIYSQGDDSTFYKQVMVTDIEEINQDTGTLNFSITFSGENLFNISSNGVMNFTANSSYLGVHNISVCVKDTGIDNPHQNISLCGQNGSSLTTCNNFSLTVTDENRAPEIISYFPLNLRFNVSGNDLLYFNITKHDADGTIPDTYWYVDNVLKEYDSGSSTDSFSYILGCGISGNHTIKSEITDGLLNDSVQWNISVVNVDCPPGVSPGTPSGSGGSAGVKVYCEEKWAWEQWPQCKNLKTEFELGEVSREYEFLIKERCSLFNWSDGFCGYQIRTGRDLNLCKYNLTRPGVIRECYYTENPTCDDNIQNCHSGGCEVLTDCGGPCKPCPTCSDKIKNQNEEEVDCGGSCPLCIERPSAKGLKWFVYIFLVAFIIILIIIIKLFIKSYKTEKEVKKLTSKRKGTLD